MEFTTHHASVLSVCNEGLILTMLFSLLNYRAYVIERDAIRLNYPVVDHLVPSYPFELSSGVSFTTQVVLQASTNEKWNAPFSGIDLSRVYHSQPGMNLI